jgi:hypothetical protein
MRGLFNKSEQIVYENKQRCSQKENPRCEGRGLDGGPSK